ncbi:MAG: HEPN domain-containing protein [Planctomycetaceae bacterium]|nr:HEPN domain-containing protein [Planctomycetaceae bacterium]
MKEYALAQWQRACQSLESARTLLDSDYDSAASRAFYAAYHAVTALFAWRNVAFKKHTALRAAIHRDLVATGQWAIELGKAYDFLLELRETGDYGGPAHVEQQDAQTAIEKAGAIIAAVKVLCPDLTR